MRFSKVVFVLLVGGSLVATQMSYDQVSADFHKDMKKAILQRENPLIPSVKVLKLMSLNNQPVVADLLWLQSIQYFGQGSPYGMYPALGPMVDAATQVDPKFEYPYEFGMVVLPFMGPDRVKIAEQMGLRAQDAISNNGLLSFYLGSIYQLNLKDYKKAAYYYDLASKQPGAPPAAAQLAGVSYNQITDSIQDRAVAMTFWETVYKNATTDEEKARAKGWFEQMKLVFELEMAASEFNHTNGRYPKDYQEMIDAKLIPGYPVSPVHRILAYDPNTGRVSFDQIDTASLDE